MKSSNIIDFQQVRKNRRSQQIKSRVFSTLSYSGILFLVGLLIYSYVLTVDLLSRSILTTPKF